MEQKSFAPNGAKMHTPLFATDPLLLRSKRALLLTEQNVYSSFCYRPFAPNGAKYKLLYRPFAAMEQKSFAPNGAKMYTALFATDPLLLRSKRALLIVSLAHTSSNPLPTHMGARAFRVNSDWSEQTTHWCAKNSFGNGSDFVVCPFESPGNPIK